MSQHGNALTRLFVKGSSVKSARAYKREQDNEISKMKRDTTRCRNFAFQLAKRCNSDDTRRFISSPCGEREATSILFHPLVHPYFLSGPSNSILPDPWSSYSPNTYPPSSHPYPREDRTRLTFTRLTKEVRDPLTLTTNLKFRKSSKSLRPSESLAFHLSGKHT